jgi:hypothetical protein
VGRDDEVVLEYISARVTFDSDRATSARIEK